MTHREASSSFTAKRERPKVTVDETKATGGLVFVGPSAASAAGISDRAGFHVTWSLNCNDRSSPCAQPDSFGLGGFWGSATLTASGTDYGQETGCGHGLIPGAAPGGASHTSFADIWVEFPSPGGPPGPVVDPNGNYLYLGNSVGSSQ